jgi:hypothetical protein
MMGARFVLQAESPSTRACGMKAGECGCPECCGGKTRAKIATPACRSQSARLMDDDDITPNAADPGKAPPRLRDQHPVETDFIARASSMNERATRSPPTSATRLASFAQKTSIAENQ